MSAKASERVCAECEKCGNVWLVAKLPMEMATVAKVAKRMCACAMCGNVEKKSILVAKTAWVQELIDAGVLA